MDVGIHFQSGTGTDADQSAFSSQKSVAAPLCNRRTRTVSQICDLRSSISTNITTTTVPILISNVLNFNCPSPVDACYDQNIILDSAFNQQNMSDTRGPKIAQVRPISSIASSSLNMKDAYFRPINSKSHQKQII